MIYLARLKIGNRKSEIGNRKSEIGNRKSEIGNRKSEIGNRKSEIGNRKSETGNYLLLTDWLVLLKTIKSVAGIFSIPFCLIMVTICPL